MADSPFKELLEEAVQGHYTAVTIVRGNGPKAYCLTIHIQNAHDDEKLADELQHGVYDYLMGFGKDKVKGKGL